MSIVQYITNIVVGFFMLAVMGAYLAVAAGIQPLGVSLIFAPMVLFGFASGLALFLPRSSAALSIVLSLPYLYVGIVDLINPLPASEPLIFLVPGIVLTTISALTLSKRRSSIWQQVTGWSSGVIIVLAGWPLVLTSYSLVKFFRAVEFHWNY